MALIKPKHYVCYKITRTFGLPNSKRVFVKGQFIFIEDDAAGSTTYCFDTEGIVWPFGELIDYRELQAAGYIEEHVYDPDPKPRDDEDSAISYVRNLARDLKWEVSNLKATLSPIADYAKYELEGLF